MALHLFFFAWEVYPGCTLTFITTDAKVILVQEVDKC